MGPGRPRIYKTPEEKTLANRAKSKRSYYKYIKCFIPSEYVVSIVVHRRRHASVKARRTVQYRNDTIK